MERATPWQGLSLRAGRFAPRRWLGALALEDVPSTAAFWAAVVACAGAVFLTSLPPLVDYPQHLAMSGVLAQLVDPAAREHAAYSADFYTYNGLFHLLVSRLALFIPVELAGKVTVAMAVGGLAAGTLVLQRSVGRAPGHAAFVVPASFSFAVTWGFINHALGIALGTFALALVARTVAKPGPVPFLATAALGLLLGFCHVLATAITCLLAVALAVELSWRHASREPRSLPARGREALRRTTVALAPFLVGGLYCVNVLLRQYAWNPGSYQDAKEGEVPPLSEKLADVGYYTTGTFQDGSDQLLLAAAVGVAAVGVVLAVARPHYGSEPPVLGPLLTAIVAYLTVPMVLVGTHLVFPRFGQILFVTLPLALPVARGFAGTVVRWSALAVGVLVALNLVVKMRQYEDRTHELSTLIGQLPTDARVAAVVHDTGPTPMNHGTLLHVAAFHGARNGGEWAFNFARFASVPLFFRPGSQPPWPYRGWEFTPTDYNPRCGYARAFPVLLVVLPMEQAAASEAEVRHLVFGADEDHPAIRLLGRAGRFWAFDTTGLPNDGTL